MNWMEFGIIAIAIVGFLMLVKTQDGALFEMLIDKLRVNVIIVAFIVAFIIINFGDRLIDALGDGNPGADDKGLITLLSTLIGVGIGGLIAAMVRMFESPSVPADVHERLMKGKEEK